MKTLGGERKIMSVVLREIASFCPLLCRCHTKWPLYHRHRRQVSLFSTIITMTSEHRTKKRRRRCYRYPTKEKAKCKMPLHIKPLCEGKKTGPKLMVFSPNFEKFSGLLLLQLRDVMFAKRKRFPWLKLKMHMSISSALQVIWLIRISACLSKASENILYRASC